MIISTILISCVTTVKKDNNPAKVQTQKYSNILTYTDFSGKQKTINLTELINAFEKFCPNNKEIIWENVKILFSLHYAGSEITQADILFLSNSIMVLVSNENRFYKYSFNNNELTIRLIDIRENVSMRLEAEKYHMEHGNVLSVNEKNKTIVYNYRNGFYFGGLGFFNQNKNHN